MPAVTVRRWCAVLRFVWEQQRVHDSALRLANAMNLPQFEAFLCRCVLPVVGEGAGVHKAGVL